MMADPTPLMRVSDDSDLFVLGLDSAAAAEEVSGWVEAGLTVRTIRGSKMRTSLRLFDEVAAAMQFPYYFGESWDALNECLSEIDWLPFGNGIVIVIREAELVLADEPASKLRKFLDVVEELPQRIRRAGR